MTDVEFAVDYLTVWAWQKARRNNGRPDPEPDPEFQAGLDRLAKVIEAELAGEPSLAQLLFEAAADLDAPAVRPLTTERVRLALLNATEDDPGSAVRLHSLVSSLHIATKSLAPGHYSTVSQSPREPWPTPEQDSPLPHPPRTPWPVPGSLPDRSTNHESAATEHGFSETVSASKPEPARAVVTVSVSTSTDRSIAMGSIPVPR